MKRIAIIPARGGSKRIKDKNIKNFIGRPIISYIINTCIKSNLFNKIHVSTDSDKIKKTVEKEGLEIDFMRPQKLADDFTPLMPVYKYVLEEYKRSNLIFEEIWVLMPCSPLIEVSDLINASKKYNNQTTKYKPLMTVSEYSVPIEWALLKENEILYPRFKNKLNERSQDLPKSFFETGTFMIFPREYINNDKDQFNENKYIGFELSKRKAIDIDDINDWEIAEALYLFKKTGISKNF